MKRGRGRIRILYFAKGVLADPGIFMRRKNELKELTGFIYDEFFNGIKFSLRITNC